ncbi:MAG: sensor histidine kinase, partial [Bacteroidaceae bacterium]|nr:sensor histidine kinase [Bacteroidaceae bacterium]
LLMDVIEEMLRAKPEYHISISYADPQAPLQSPQGGKMLSGSALSPLGESEGALSVIANRYLLALAFRNLIENNCKYSSDHTSHVSIGVQQGLYVTFADNGIGMTPAEHRNLFRMFYRGSNHTEGGHGIGMALVQRIMVLHNACIDVQSKFQLSMPARLM